VNDNNRAEVATSLFINAMEIRYKQPLQSLELLREVLSMDPQHNEARLKSSWLELRLNNYSAVHTILQPVIASQRSTLEQKQRAYNNMTCACLFVSPPECTKAEKLALTGIQLDGNGTPKLWENYGSALQQQDRLPEALEAFTKSLLLEPESVKARNFIKETEKQIKRNSKKSKGKDKKFNAKTIQSYDIFDKENYKDDMNTPKSAHLLSRKSGAKTKSRSNSVEHC